MEGKLSPTLSHPPHTHTMSWAGPRPSLVQVAVHKPHSCYPCSIAASATETIQELSPALLDLEQVQQKALNITSQMV